MITSFVQLLTGGLLTNLITISALDLDLNNKILSKAIKAFSPLRIRIGGSPQDQLLYKVGNSVKTSSCTKRCPHFKLKKDGLFGFSKGSLSMDRCGQINDLVNQTGAVMTFGLNALIGRKKSKADDTLWVGDWNPKNAHNLINYSISKGYKIESYELGSILPKPDCSDIQRCLCDCQRIRPWSGPWVGEAGGAYNSRGKYVSHTFANGFWYLAQLRMTSTFNHKGFCRQALIGGNYALLNTTTVIPNPDYYGALLWHRLMGKHVLSATHSGSPYLRAYSHCSKQKRRIYKLKN